MAEQMSMGVLRDAKPEKFVIVTVDTGSAQFLKRIAFLDEEQFRDAFKHLNESELEALLAQVRAHPVD